MVHTEGAGELAGLKPVWAADPKDQTEGKRQKEAILEENLCGGEELVPSSGGILVKCGLSKLVKLCEKGSLGGLNFRNVPHGEYYVL